MTSLRANFGHDTTTDQVLEGLDLSGKLALVTGASGGLDAARRLWTLSEELVGQGIPL